MKYIIIIFSLTLCFACSSSEKESSKDSQNITTTTKQGSNKSNVNKTKKNGVKSSTKMGKKYRGFVSQNILTKDQAKRLQAIDIEFADKKNELLKNGQWKGKDNVKNRRNHNIAKNTSIISEFGEDVHQKIVAFNTAKKNDRSSKK